VVKIFFGLAWGTAKGESVKNTKKKRQTFFFLKTRFWCLENHKIRKKIVLLKISLQKKEKKILKHIF